ncbi:MAG: ATP-dependent Clp protease ATP-binding subunit [Candidatus Paceibacterota bacterium]
MFNLKQAEIYAAVKKEKEFKTIFVLELICFSGFAAIGLFLLFKIFQGEASAKIATLLEGIALIFFIFYLWFKTLNDFFENDLKNPQLKKTLAEAIVDPSANLADWLNFNSAKYLSASFRLAEKAKLSAPTATQLLSSFLDEKNPKIIFLFSRLSIAAAPFKKELLEIIDKNILDSSSDFGKIVSEAANTCVKRNGDKITEGDIIAALSEVEPNFKKILIDLEMGREDIENVSWWIESINKRTKTRKAFGSYENLIKAGSVGGDLAFGYTITLDKFSLDWTNQIRARGYEDIIGHKTETDLAEKILSRKGPRNVLLVGEAGSGRKSIVHRIIKKSLSSQAGPALNNKRFLQLDIVALSASVSSFEETEATISKCLNEALLAGNIVLIINDLHDFLGAEKKAGITDISGILLPYLTDPRLQMICLTTPHGLHKYIEAKPAILNLFEKIDVPEISAAETTLILENRVFVLENEYKKFITYEAIKEIIELSGKYVSAPYPQKAVSLLQDAFTYSSQHSETSLILPEHIDQILSQKTKIPLGKVNSEEKNALLNMEAALHKRVVSQNEAIEEISSAMRRARSGIRTGKGPMGSFLFLGPTGVGKTETAKALAEIYFGSEDKMVRLDMSEFQRVDDIPRLIGSDAQNGILTTAVRENPFSLVLLDEVEKAYPDILNLFLQILDEGYVNDNLGNKVNFSNTIIIATSNAGYKVILEAIKENKEKEQIKKDLLDYVFANNIFRPELVNRFDGVVMFKSLSQSDLQQIAQLQLNKIAANLKKKKIEFIITDELKNKIVELGFHPVFGAREMKRVIQDNLENSIAKALLADKIAPGNSIEINPNNFSVVVK